MTYVMKVLIAVDQLANAVRGGHPDETQLERDQYGNLVKATQIERDAE